MAYLTRHLQSAFGYTMIIIKYISIFGLLTLSLGVAAQGLDNAQQAISAEQYQSAIAILKAKIRLQPKAGENYYHLGNVYILTGRPDSAKTVFTQGIRFDAKQPLNYVGIGKLNLQTENTLAAKVNFDKAVSLSGRRKYEAQLAIGNAYLQTTKPDFSAALPFLQQADALDKSDKDARIFLALGDYHGLQRQTAKALEQYRKAAQIDSTLMQVGLHVAEMHLKAGQYVEAEAALQDLLKKDANYAPAYRLHSEMYQQQYLSGNKQTDIASGAIASYRRYLELTGADPALKLNFAQLLYTLGDFSTIETELASLTTVDPASTNGLMITRLRGYAAYENGNYPAALQHMNSLLERTADKTKITADDYTYLSLIQQKLKLTDVALESSTKAIKLDSSKTSAIEAIGKDYYNARNWAQAISTYELLRSLGGKPADIGEVGMYHGTALFFRYVEAFNKQENPPGNWLLQANASFNQVLQAVPSRFEAYLWSGRALSLLEDRLFPKGAMVKPYQAYIEGVERSGQAQSAATKRNLVEAGNAIATFAASRGDRDMARTYWGKVLQLDPQDVTAVSGMKALNGGSRSSRNR